MQAKTKKQIRSLLVKMNSIKNKIEREISDLKKLNAQFEELVNDLEVEATNIEYGISEIKSSCDIIFSSLKEPAKQK